MERLRDGFHQKNKIYQQNVFSLFTQGRLKILDVIVIKSHNTCAKQLASSVQLPPSKILKKNLYIVWLSTLSLIQG